MLCGIRQLLFNPFHNLPEGRSVEWVSIPAGPHNMIPAQQQKHINTFTCLQLLHRPVLFSYVYIFLVSVQPKSFCYTVLVNSQMQQDESRLLCKSHTLQFFYILTTSIHHFTPSLLCSFYTHLLTFYNNSHFTGCKLWSIHPLSFFYQFVELGIHRLARIRTVSYI